MIERPVSQEQCKELGGHYWNEYRQGADVNEFGEQEGPLLNVSTADMSTLYDTIERDKLRTCALCGKTEKYVEEWREVE